MKKLTLLLMPLFLPLFSLSAQSGIQDTRIANDRKTSNTCHDIFKPGNPSFSNRNIAFSDHLIVINGKISNIDPGMCKPADIESLSVSYSAKDKDAYGVLADNGVIYITTKKNVAITSQNDQPLKPLVLVDGRVYTNSLDSINYQEIESVTVLKDFSATKTYGKAGDNGVILIKRKAHSGKQ